jgi:hypothetical protein
VARTGAAAETLETVLEGLVPLSDDATTNAAAIGAGFRLLRTVATPVTVVEIVTGSGAVGRVTGVVVDGDALSTVPVVGPVNRTGTSATDDCCSGSAMVSGPGDTRLPVKVGPAVGASG